MEAMHFDKEVSLVKKTLSRHAFLRETHRCNHVRVVFVLALIVFAVPLSAQRITGRFMTSLYGWERFDTVDVSRSILRGSQTAFIDITHSNVSLHSFFDGAGTLDSSFSESTQFNVYNLFLRVREVLGSEIQLGRMPYFVGAGVGTMDGLLARIPVVEGYRLTLYGGQTVLPDLSFGGDIKERFVFGGQVLMTSIPSMRIGLSYMNRQRKPESYRGLREDANLQPIEVLIDPSVLKEQYVNADVSYHSNVVSVYVRYDHDLNLSQLKRAQANVEVPVMENLRIAADVIHRAPTMPFNSFFSVFSVTNTTEAELGADYIMDAVRVYARGGMVTYDEETSARFSAGVSTEYGSLSYRGTSGYAGELSSIHLSLAYPLFERQFIPSCGIGFSSYKLSEHAEKSDVLSLSAGGVFRPMQSLSADAQMQWLSNPIYKSDVRGFVRFSFWFSEQTNILR